MKKHIYKILTVFFLFAITTSCSDFGDLDVNPNEPTIVGTENLLANAERSISDVVGAYMGTLYIQHFSQITYTEDSRYQAIRADFTAWYSNTVTADGAPLVNLQYIIDINTDPETSSNANVLSGGSNANQIAAARILKAYFYMFITDRWGPVPYSDALKAEEGFQPAYDSQQAIYADLINELKEAVTQIDNGAPVAGDFIFGGDMAAWASFANTIRMVAALRMADVNASTAQSEFNDAISDGVINADLFYPYLANADNQNPWYARYITRTDYAISNTMFDWLDATNDPRLASFADTIATGEIVPMPYGLETPTQQPSDVSFPNSTYIKAQDAPLPIFTLAQVNFSRAEAAARGWTADIAETLYQDAIKASWDQWDVTYDDAAFNTFYGDPAITWNAANWKVLIGRQKWIALFAQGYEAWAEWRRLDEPQLTVAEAPLNPSLQIPMRNMYPTTEFDLNETNYQYAVDTYLGGENTDGTKLWWDVN